MLTLIKQKLSEHTISSDVDKVIKRNAFPMSEQSSYLKKNANGEFLTGYNLPFGLSDEEVLKDPKSVYYDLITEKKKIEKALNVSLDPNKDNEFLLFLKLELTNKNNQDPRLDLDKPMDKLKYRAAIASGIVAPSRELLSDIRFMASDFYFSSPEKESSSKKVKEKLKNQIAGALSNHENSRAWLMSVSNKLGLLTRPELTEDLLYTQISEAKNKTDKEEELKKIVSIVTSQIDILLIDLVIDKSFYYQLIKKTETGQYSYKSILLGKTKDEVKDFLTDFANQDIFAELRMDVFEKLKIK